MKNNIGIESGKILMQFEHQVRILESILKKYQISPFGGSNTTSKEIVKGEKGLMECLYSIVQHITLRNSLNDNHEFEQNYLNRYIEGGETYKYEYIGEESELSSYHKGDNIEISSQIKCYYKDNYRFELTITKMEKNSLQESKQIERFIILDNEINLISKSNETLTEKDKSKGIKEPNRYQVKFLPGASCREISSIEENFIKSLLTNTDYKHVDPVDTDDSVFTKFLKGPTYVNFHNRGKGTKFGATYKSICCFNSGICENEEMTLDNDSSLIYEYRVLWDNKRIVFKISGKGECKLRLESDEDVSIPSEILEKLKDKITIAKQWNYELDISPNILYLSSENTEQVIR